MARQVSRLLISSCTLAYVGQASTSSFNLFGGAKDEKKADAGMSLSLCVCTRLINPGATAAAPAAGTTATSGTGATTATAPAGSAVTVAPPSMLRGKTIEEIVNRWSTELETHVREFNKFASEVAVWDRALIENGNNVSLRPLAIWCMFSTRVSLRGYTPRYSLPSGNKMTSINPSST